MNKAVLILRLVIIGLFLFVVVMAMISAGYISFTKESSDMDVRGVSTVSVPGNGIPPIDAAAPADTEVATFALG